MRRHAPIKDHISERRTFAARTMFAFVMVVILMMVLVGRMVYLQVYQHDVYATISDRNRVQLEPVAPTRGLIYDTHGNLLADNRPSYNLGLVKERVDNLEATIAELARLVPIAERDIRGFYKRLEERRRPYESVALRFRMSEDEIARIAINFHRCPVCRLMPI